MKTKTLLLFFIFATVTLHAQVSKTVNCTAGGLATLLTSTEKATVTNLTLTGTIDSRDFPTMKNMPLLAVIDMSAVTIEAYNGFGASKIADYAFKDNKKLESVLLPSSLTSIGGASFGGCNSLTSVLIPTSVTSINNSAFYGCSGLTSITIPSSVTSIADHTFSDCSGLTSVSISTSATTIGAYAFSRCSGLTSVSIPSLVTFISNSAFWGCSGLTSVSIPNSVQMIGDGAFLSCNKLTSVFIPSSVIIIGENAFPMTVLYTVDDANANYSSADGVLFNKTKTTLILYPTSMSGDYTIPSTVTTIESSAFSNCSGLSLVTIPSLVTTIGNSAFNGCSGLSSVTTYAKIPISLHSSVFTNLTKTTCNLYVPAGSKALYQAAPVWKDFMNIVEMIDVSVQSQALANVKIYPNPVVESFKISGLIGSVEITILNTNCQVVLHQNVFDNQPIAVGFLQKGAYFVYTHTNKGTTVIRFLKK